MSCIAFFLLLAKSTATFSGWLIIRLCNAFLQMDKALHVDTDGELLQLARCDDFMQGIQL